VVVNPLGFGSLVSVEPLVASQASGIFKSPEGSLKVLFGKACLVKHDRLANIWLDDRWGWEYLYLQRETEEKAHQPETKLSAIAQTHHISRLGIFLSTQDST
jgi:hypothetical protein